MHPRFFLLFLALVWPFAAEASAHAALALVSPSDGAVVKENNPALAWSASDADLFEIWLDGRKQGTVSGDVRSWVPFPLSFGRHTWHVVALKDGVRMEAPVASFEVQDAPLTRLPQSALLLRHGWMVQSALTTQAGGETLSRVGAVGTGWVETSLPATALTALVRSGAYPDPYVGLNNLRIPDAGRKLNEAYSLLNYSHIPGKNPWSAPYWFLNTFRLPDSYAGRRIWLHLGEVNYRADVWVDGRRVAWGVAWGGIDQPRCVELTQALAKGELHHLAIAVSGVDQPGEPAPPPDTPLANPGRNMGANTGIARNHTKWDTAGWDFVPEVRDRALGLTEDVYLSSSDDVRVRDGYAGAEVQLEPAPLARVHVSFDVDNLTTETVEADGEVVLRQQGRTLATIPLRLRLRPGLSNIRIAPEAPGLVLQRPALWWPRGWGPQDLHTVTIVLRRDGREVAGEEFSFGIRKIDTEIDPVLGARRFRINGRPFYGQGGNWVPDMMLNWTASRYEEEIRLAAAAGLNYLRLWGPSSAPPPALYEAADREGILIQQDFLHDFWGTNRNAPRVYPPEETYRRGTSALIRRFRNHPSLFIWCGGNEGPNPREEMIVRELLPALDPHGGRFYLLGSDRDGFKGGGPYHTLSPEDYFKHPKLSQFNSEIGPSGVPEIESLRRFITVPTHGWAEGRFPLDGQWAYHDANDWPLSDLRKFSSLDTLLRRTYGAPTTTDAPGFHAYVRRLQWVSHDAYRAAIEALNRELGVKNSGFCLWKLNAAWPSMTWQLFDWYRQAHAGFFAVRLATRPLHVQRNADDGTLAVINRAGVSLPASRLEVTRWTKGRQSRTIHEVPAFSTLSLPLPVTISEDSTLELVRLRWLAPDGEEWACNTYWLAPGRDLKEVFSLAPTKLQLTAVRTEKGLRVTITNAGEAPAGLVRLQWLDARSGLEVLPNLWTENYPNLLPGETRTVDVEGTAPSAGMLRATADNGSVEAPAP